MAEDRNIGDRSRKDMDRDRNQSQGSGSSVGQTGSGSDLDRGSNRSGSDNISDRPTQGMERKRPGMEETEDIEE